MPKCNSECQALLTDTKLHSTAGYSAERQSCGRMHRAERKEFVSRCLLDVGQYIEEEATLVCTDFEA